MGRLNHHLVWASTGKALARLHWWANSAIILCGQALGRLWQDCTDGQTQPSSCVGKHWAGSVKTALMGRPNYHLVWASTGKALARLHWWADSTIIMCGQALGRLWQDCTDGQTQPSSCVGKHWESSGKTALMGRLNHHLVWASTGKALARLHWWANSAIILCGQALGRLWQDCTDGQTQPSSFVGKHWEGSGKTALMGRLNHHLLWASTGKALARLHWWADSTIIWQDCTDGQTQPSSCLGKHWEGSGETALMGRLNHHLVWASIWKALARLHWWADSTIILFGQALGRL